MQSKADTVQKYLAELPADRRAALQVVRETIVKNLDEGVVEGMQYGMIGYAVPHSVYPAGYHCDATQPVPFAALASQKSAMSLYLMATYLDEGEREWLQAAWAKTGKKLDMGKSCIRFKKVEDLALDVIAEAIRRMPVRTFIAAYEAQLPAGKKTTKVAKAAVTNKKVAKVAGKKTAKRVAKRA